MDFFLSLESASLLLYLSVLSLMSSLNYPNIPLRHQFSQKIIMKRIGWMQPSHFLSLSVCVSLSIFLDEMKKTKGIGWILDGYWAA